MQPLRLLFLFTGLIFILPASAQFSIVGNITITTPFRHQSEFYKWYYDSTFYEQARTTSSYECLQLQYKSGIAEIEAWLYKPVTAGRKKLPVIIYNRGGMGNFGNLTQENLVDFYKFAESGFLVLATKTRFAGKDGKYDQHGGVDVLDIVNLQNIYRTLPYADTNNVFMYGFSRGGQNTYQASLRMNLNAMAVTAGTADWISRIRDREEFLEGWTDEDSSLNYLGFRKNIPGWDNDSLAPLIERSAVFWAEKINTPVLIMHSRQDTKVSCMDAIKMAEQLQLFDKSYQLIIYDEPSHSLPFSQFDSYDQMIRWFNKHMKTPAK